MRGVHKFVSGMLQTYWQRVHTFRVHILRVHILFQEKLQTYWQTVHTCRVHILRVHILVAGKAPNILAKSVSLLRTGVYKQAEKEFAS